MKKLLTFAASAFTAAGVSLSAQAAVIDFGAYATGNENGINSGDSIANFAGTGIDIQFFAGNFHPYFDGPDGALPAGLGVCRALDLQSQCVDSSDDSIDGESAIVETISLAFTSGPIDLAGLSFRDGAHFDINNSNGLVDFIFNRGALPQIAGTSTFAALVTLAGSGALTGVTDFSLSWNDTDFYLEALTTSVSDVPIPAALPLLLSGIAGLGFASRRKRQTA